MRYLFSMASTSTFLSYLPILLLLLVVCCSNGLENGLLLNHICSSNGNYTDKSTYETNLKLLLPSLNSNGSATGFFNDSKGDIPNRIYGLVLCRGDVNAEACRSCLTTASQDVLQLCPYNKGAIVWYDYCLVRYSIQNFFSSTDGSDMFYMFNTQNVTEAPDLFKSRLDGMMNTLVNYTVNNSSRLFATGQVDFTTGTPLIYGLTQCSRDLSADQCKKCLQELLSVSPNDLQGKRGGRVIKASCNVRYELYSFYNMTALVSIPAPIITKNTTLPPMPSTNSTNTTTPNMTIPSGSNPTSQGDNKDSTGMLLAIVIPVAVALLLISAICICFWRRKKATKKKRYGAGGQEIITIESLLFDLSTLKVATNDFSDSNKLGEGGFGAVYMGTLSDGQEIAVKRLSTYSAQGLEELKNEVVLLAKLQHRNLVRLLGVCLEEEEKLLVYEYVVNRSLYTFLFDPTKHDQINWGRRYKIIGGIARGLLYLHEDSQVKIIHRDLKAGNILLDAGMNPKISDFGFARLFGGDQTQASTNRVVGSYGYMAPEYAMRGHFSNKSDVFGFGVLVLEIVTGRKNSSFSSSDQSDDLLSYVWEHWSNGTITEVIDRSLGAHYPRNEVLQCIHIGLLCVQDAPADRPTMSSVILMLNSYSMTLQVPLQPAFLPGYSRFKDGDLFQSTPSQSTNKTEPLLSRHD